jgi:hypothetical protein
VQIQSPFQVLVVDGVEFGFEADVAIDADQGPRTRGFGFVEISSSDGDALQLAPVWGTVDGKTGGVVLILIPIIDRPIEPDDLVAAIVQPAPTDPDCLIWDFTGTAVLSGLLPPPFAAAGSISRTRGPEWVLIDPVITPPILDGQLDAWVLIDTPLQPVAPPPPSSIVGVDALIGLDPHQEARGYLDVYRPRGEPICYEPLLGWAVFPADDAIIHRTVLILLLADRQAPLNTNDHLLRATVTASRDDPDGLIWDLVNGETRLVEGTFEAFGELTAWPARGPGNALNGFRQEQLNNRYTENLPR